MKLDATSMMCIVVLSIVTSNIGYANGCSLIDSSIIVTSNIGDVNDSIINNKNKSTTSGCSIIVTNNVDTSGDDANSSTIVITDVNDWIGCEARINFVNSNVNNYDCNIDDTNSSISIGSICTCSIDNRSTTNYHYDSSLINTSITGVDMTVIDWNSSSVSSTIIIDTTSNIELSSSSPLLSPLSLSLKVTDNIVIISSAYNQTLIGGTIYIDTTSKLECYFRRDYCHHRCHH